MVPHRHSGSAVSVNPLFLFVLKTIWKNKNTMSSIKSEIGKFAFVSRVTWMTNYEWCCTTQQMGSGNDQPMMNYDFVLELGSVITKGISSNAVNSEK